LTFRQAEVYEKQADVLPREWKVADSKLWRRENFAILVSSPDEALWNPGFLSPGRLPQATRTLKPDGIVSSNR
jgi:hypothetical protein